MPGSGPSRLRDFHQAIRPLPVGTHVAEGTVNFFLRNLGIGASQNGRGFTFCRFEQLAIADEVRNLKARQPGLTGPEEFAWTAELKVKLGDLEAIIGTDHGIQSAFTLLRNFAPGHQNAMRFGRAAADASSQLVKLRQSEALGMFDHHYGRVGNIHADLDHRRGD